MKHHLDDLNDIFGRRIGDVIVEDGTKRDKGVLKEVYNFILKYRYDVRTYALNPASDYITIWEELREHESAMDFVMNVTRDITFLLGKEVQSSLVRDISKAIGDMNSSTIIDLDTRSRLPTSNDLDEALNDNPVILTVYLLSYIDSEVLLKGLTTLKGYEKPQTSRSGAK